MRVIIPKFAGYLPYTGTSSVRVLQDPREEGFLRIAAAYLFGLPLAILSTTDAADPSVLTDPSTVKTNLIPERIEKTYSVSSQMMTSTNSGPETVVLSNVVGGRVIRHKTLLEGFELDGTMGDVLPPSGQASLRDLLPYFSSPGNRPSATLPNGGLGATTPFCSANATKATCKITSTTP